MFDYRLGKQHKAGRIDPAFIFLSLAYLFCSAPINSQTSKKMDDLAKKLTNAYQQAVATPKPTRRQKSLINLLTLPKN